MQRPAFPWIWVVLAAILLLLPGTAGRLLLDLLGGLTLLFLLLPLFAAGAGFLAWQAIRSRLSTCEVCGTTSFGSRSCPGCGSPLNGKTTGSGSVSESAAIPASQVTIDVEAVDVNPAPEGNSRPSS